MVLFKDLDKAASDLLRNDFPHDKPWEVEFSPSTKNPQFTQNAGVNSKAALQASTKAKFVNNGGTVEIKLVDGGAGYIDTKYQNDKWYKGLTVGQRFERAGSITSNNLLSFLNLYAEHKAGNFHSNISINPYAAKWSSATVFNYGNLGSTMTYLGSEISGGVEKESIKYSIGAAVMSKVKDNNLAWIASVKTLPAEGSPIGKLVGKIHTVSKGATPAELACEATVSLNDRKTSVSFVGQWHLNDSKDSIMKTKICNNAKIATSLTHKVNENMTVILGAQIDGKNTSSPDGVKYGVKIKATA